MMFFSQLHRPALLVLLFVVSASAGAADFDVVIRHARILDGSGNPYFVGDIGIRSDSIVAIGNLAQKTGSRTIDASGRYAAPGFIDMHSHADLGLSSDNLDERRAPNLVKQGITTVVVGSDGDNITFPLKAEIDRYNSGGIGLNIVPMVGHGTVRREVMGDDYERYATDQEISRMQQLVRESMQAGAWGLTAGLEYRPGRFSNTQEIVALAKVVAEFDGFYTAHQRSQSPLPLWELPSNLQGRWRLTGTDAMKETIEIGRESGIRVVGSHIKAKGPTSWGQSSKDILLVKRAREEGVQAYLDQYPFETFGGTAAVVIPNWVFAPPGTDRSGGADSPKWNDEDLYVHYKSNLRANLADESTRQAAFQDIQYTLDLQGGAARHIIVFSPKDPSIVGKSLLEVAEDNHQTPIEQLIDFALSSSPDLRSGVLFRPIAGSAYDVENYMQQEFTATSTDGVIVLKVIPGHHPRHFSTYPHKLAYYARDRNVISLAFAVRSSSGLPAQIIGLPDRGHIAVGWKADIVLFRLSALPSNISMVNPDQCCKGMDYVISNGVFLVDDGKLTGLLPGRVLRKQSSGQDN